MSLAVLILVITIGVVLVALEIVALPGGVAGVCGSIMVVLGVALTYTNYGSTPGTIALLSSIVACVILLVVLLKARTWRRVSLNDEIDSKANIVTLKVGDCGTTISRLAPAGKAIIEGQTVEVHADNVFLDPNTPICITEIDGYFIKVAPIKEQ